ncbi:rod shape-determining protein MreD [Marichromatium purpuratum 984]|uniref:Rod shape-determining protein MreD n=1 Tax=Marichromatium purpuratum 984 TaxID=765910 RepID=W0E8D2_MARPU|nr:rod shape-determining protein MreD [Marichromatium purpuratum]AHF05306.1 rod shape-determining protein MreD [Marichromatium purpuratum 984]
MSETRPRGGWLIGLSLFVAFALSILPMPLPAEALRPQWVAMVVVFWCLHTPERIGVFSAFASGVALDVISGTLLGQHALTLSLLAYLVVELHQRIRIFPMWQQTLFVWVLLLAERLLTLWVLGATGQPMPALSYWAPTFLGLIFWPWMSALLGDLGRRAGAL